MFATELLPSPVADRYSGTDEVPRLTGAKARAYLDQAVLPSRPVVLPDIMKGCAALRKWTPAFFRENYPQASDEVNGTPVPLREQIDRIAVSSKEDPAPYPYSLDVRQAMPELLADLRPMIRFGSTDRTFDPLVPGAFLGGTTVHELFFGGCGASYPQPQYDLLAMHTQITQVHGEKEFFLYDPTQTPLLYPDPDRPRVSRIPNVFDPDLSRFPAFSRARAVRVLLRQGETLFFPSGWWHTTRMHGPSITYGRAVLNATNWSGMVRERCQGWRKTHPTMAVPALVFGQALGLVLRMKEYAWPTTHMT